MVSLEDIRSAAVRLADVIAATPSVAWQRPASAGAWPPALYLKCENLNPTGSFKVRGASNCVAALMAGEAPPAGVVTASSGNHGQAVAWAARRAGVPAVVVVPEDAAAPKVAGARALGAEVVAAGRTSTSRISRALEIAKERGLTYISSFDDDRVIAGQGTIGLELLAQVPGLRRVVLPIGGGGLISGVATAIKEMDPSIRVIGVEPVGSDCAGRARSAGAPVTLASPATLADGLRTMRVGELTWPIIQRYVDDLVTVSEESIRAAMVLLASSAHLIAEPSGAVTTAALLDGAVEDAPDTAVVVSGGNVDTALFAQILSAG